MKKIGIVTLSNSINYGGVLQAVALAKVLRKLGTEPINITCLKMQRTWNSPITYLKNRVERYGSKGLKTKLRICGGMAKTVLSNIHWRDVCAKKRKFVEFIQQQITVTPYYASQEQLQSECGDYDAYITGSDQVWNNSFTHNNFLGAFFLEFAPKTAPKYAYAASVGGEKSDAYIEEIICRTRDFAGISVREKSLEDHMKKLGCENVKTVLDPTLLLSKEDWQELARKPQRNVPEHYILVYYLEKSAYNDPIITHVSRELGLPVVDIMPTRKSASYDRIADYTAGPAEFIYYIENADYIITNSFHMVVFSLIFEKNFLALRRDGQETRIKDLLQSVYLDSHLIDSPEQWEVIRQEVKEVVIELGEKRESSMKLLKDIAE